eukprot:TRINITY_DN6093_c0_g1_i1.p1 TRINITY_DN6093_c0_g1~~TRINITY_DN6093_c0_g1_i1.p1  ORF type:complete len:248 (+),score=36.30 TRINITY_DN6093_c0_g1_i1:712-1455(+)
MNNTNPTPQVGTRAKAIAFTKKNCLQHQKISKNYMNSFTIFSELQKSLKSRKLLLSLIQFFWRALLITGTSLPQEWFKILKFLQNKAGHPKRVKTRTLCMTSILQDALRLVGTKFLMDVGWHGAGVYFTTYAMYACGFCKNRADPALLISFVTLGNVYPVTERHTGPNSLMGQRLKPGYTAHYAAIGGDGAVPGKWDDLDNLYDELVVCQEPQMTPVYIIRLSERSLADVLSEWDSEKKTVSFAPID